MSSALDITRAVNPPRAAFLDYPLGHTTGKPHEPELQRDILVQALTGLTSLTTPGSILVLPFRWSEDEDWKRTAMMDGDTRLPRYDTPQYQNEDDRRRAEENNPEACAVCEMSA
jgi:D-proline reductase (dithiol) PrdB